MDYIYLDNDASTRVDDEVVEAMIPFFTKDYGMASSDFGHTYGVKCRRAIEEARAIIAEKINAEPEEVLFTSGVAESNNTAIRGMGMGKNGNMVTSTIEQKTVLNVMKFLEDHKRVKRAVVGVDNEGFVDFEELERVITKDTRVVSIQHANHEIGTIQDIARIGRLCSEKGIPFHTDASHSFLKTDIDVERMNIDLMTISAHNIYGPKGVGALYVRKGIEITPLLIGGGEQRGLRSGLEDVPAIVGFAKAVEIYNEKDNAKMRVLRDYLIDGLLGIEDTHLNGPKGKKRLCNNANITFKYVEGESILLHLDMRGIAVTTGSACFSRELTPSHVIHAIGGSHADAHGSVRFSLSKYNNRQEMDYTVKNVREVVEKLREISPVGGGKTKRGTKD